MYSLLPLTILFLSAGTCLALAIFGKITLTIFFLFLFFSGAVLFIVYRTRLSILARNRSKIEDYQEKINILTETIRARKKILDGLPEREKKVHHLFDLSNKLAALTDHEEIFDYIIDICRRLFPEADNILLFIFQKDKNNLSLTRSFKRQKLVIKEKHGDIIDKWVIKQNQSLLIEDITRDFRFNYETVPAFKERGIRSFSANPIVVGDKISGAMRLESADPGKFSLADLRLLSSICNLAAVVLERAGLFAMIEELATRDALTGLVLRDYFIERLKTEIKRARIKKSCIGLVMVDIDNFKTINDTYGHIVGDLALKKLSRIFAKNLDKPGNIACRFGGEEFILMLVETNRQDTETTAEKIRREVDDTAIGFRRKKIEFTISGGTAVYPDDGADILDLIERADSLLYQAKTTGKNKICS